MTEKKSTIDILGQLFTRRWILSTLLVLAVCAGFVRLGFWQLDRMATRKAQVAETQAQVNAPVLVLDAETLQTTPDLENMQYRHVQVTGVYDMTAEVVLRNQMWVDVHTVRYNGVHLLTPLIIHGTDTAVLIDRGWIPADDAAAQARRKYDISGEVTVSGIIRRTETESEFGAVQETTLAPDETRRDIWHFVNVEAIGSALDYPLLPVYVQEEPDGEDHQLPYAIREYPDLSEGAHLGYAFQWFALAAITLIGYPIMVKRQDGAGEEDE